MILEGPGLEPLRQILGATGLGAQITEFPDGIATQTIDVGPIIRRGRTFSVSEGLYAATITNTHGGAGAVTTQVDPYAVAAPAAGYPSPVPAGFDVWVLACQVAAATGVQSATLSSRAGIVHPALAKAFGTAGTTTQIIRTVLTEVLTSAAVAYLTDSSGIIAYHGPALRVPRGALLTCTSQAAMAGDIIFEFMLGLFPAALGQDGRS